MINPGKSELAPCTKCYARSAYSTYIHAPYSTYLSTTLAWLSSRAICSSTRPERGLPCGGAGFPQAPSHHMITWKTKCPRARRTDAARNASYGVRNTEYWKHDHFMIVSKREDIPVLGCRVQNCDGNILLDNAKKGHSRPLAYQYLAWPARRTRNHANPQEMQSMKLEFGKALQPHAQAIFHNYMHTLY